jgi:hypothetical protein
MDLAGFVSMVGVSFATLVPFVAAMASSLSPRRRP